MRIDVYLVLRHELNDSKNTGLEIKKSEIALWIQYALRRQEN